MRLHPRVVAAIEREHRAEEVSETVDQLRELGIFRAEHGLETIERRTVEVGGRDGLRGQRRDERGGAGLRGAETVERGVALRGCELGVKREDFRGCVGSFRSSERGECRVAKLQIGRRLGKFCEEFALAAPQRRQRS